MSTGNSTRTKHVFQDIDEIAHLWAHQAQDAARNPQGNFYFTGDTIYSYGSHFPIAKIVTVPKGHNKGKQAVLFTNKGYSKTTAKHVKAVYSAIHRYDRAIDGGTWVQADRPVFSVEIPRSTSDYDMRHLLQEWDKRINYATTNAADTPKGTRETTKAKLFHTLVQIVANANAFAAYFGERKRWKVPANLEALAVKLRAAHEKEQRARAKAEAERQAKRETRYNMLRTVAVPRWIAGGGDRLEVELGGGVIGELPEASLRIVNTAALLAPLASIADAEVETSHGARFPLSHALRAMRIIQRLRANREADKAEGLERHYDAPLYRHNGHTIHLGHYALDEVRADGTIIAGCHIITPAEFDRFAAILETLPTQEVPNV